MTSKSNKKVELTPQQVDYLFSKTSGLYKQPVRLEKIEERTSRNTGLPYKILHVQWQVGNTISTEPLFVTAQAAADVEQAVEGLFYEVEVLKSESSPYRSNGSLKTSTRHQLIGMTRMDADA